MSNERQQNAVQPPQGAINAVQGDVSQTFIDTGGGDYVAGNKIVNLGTVIFGADPSAEQRERLNDYLRRLIARLQRLPLAALAPRLDDGPGIPMHKVYVQLATNATAYVATGSRDQVRQYFVEGDVRQALLPEYLPETALPATAVQMVVLSRSEQAHNSSAASATNWSKSLASAPELGALVDDPTMFWRLVRAQLATEAVAQNPHLVLLGMPGGGKSTFLRHLAWTLARRARDGDAQAQLIGWSESAPVLPLILPLRHLAEQPTAPGALIAALRGNLLREYGVREPDELLDGALAGGALLLLDGLDEIPATGGPGMLSRIATLEAVREFAELYPAVRCVLTCRLRAFDERLRQRLGWPEQTIAPFTPGQIRHFAAEWYAALADRDAISRERSTLLSATLNDTLARSERLRAMATTPLLLTMMVLVLAERGELPRDRSQLYERILGLLLGEWDQARDGQSLSESIGRPDWNIERIRPLLDRLSYDAHRQAATADGRGLLPRGLVRDALIEYFAALGFDGEAWAAAGRCLEYFDQRSGLLLAGDSDDSYAFAHLTLQEHCAGRHLVLRRDAVAEVLRHRSDDYWREAILLGLGVVQPTNPWLIESLLRRLLDAHETGQAKEVTRRQRDAILAGEIGADRDWNILREQGVDVSALQQSLREALVALLADARQPLPIAERVRAGRMLGDLGDPRFPVTVAAWQAEVKRAIAGEPAGYFCKVGAPGIWIGRYEITNAQLRPWLDGPSTGPVRSLTTPQFNGANQPAAGINRRMAIAYCAWLSEQLNGVLRLPTAAEWELAASGGDGRRYPWGNQRVRDRAAIKEDHDLRGWPYPAPVGCYPAGAAACGALDMAGNVWEWAADDAYQATRGVLKGGAYTSPKRQTTCTARIELPPDAAFDNGFRVVLEQTELLDPARRGAGDTLRR